MSDLHFQTQCVDYSDNSKTRVQMCKSTCTKCLYLLWFTKLLWKMQQVLKLSNQTLVHFSLSLKNVANNLCNSIFMFDIFDLYWKCKYFFQSFSFAKIIHAFSKNWTWFTDHKNTGFQIQTKVSYKLLYYFLKSFKKNFWLELWKITTIFG